MIHELLDGVIVPLLTLASFVFTVTILSLARGRLPSFWEVFYLFLATAVSSVVSVALWRRYGRED